ncbi:MAG TPA: hypothetical protein VJG48_01075 [Candidatus Paceibacterota bacterium]
MSKTNAKTNKSYTSRLKVTKRGKIISRKAGHAKYNAKASRSSQLNRKRGQQHTMKMKVVGLNMPQMAKFIN